MIEERFEASAGGAFQQQLAEKASDSGVAAQNKRLFLEAVFRRVRTGSPWRELPSYFGKWDSQFRRFRSWAKFGFFESLFNAMATTTSKLSLMAQSFRFTKRRLARRGLRLMP